MPRQYYLATHIHVCCTGRYCIFLDLRKDRYFSIAESLLAPLTPYIHEWTITAPPQTYTGSDLSIDEAQLAGSLLTCGVLKLDAARAKPARRLITPAPTGDVPSLLDEHRIRGGSQVSTRVWRSLTYAHAQLTCWSLRRIIATTTRRKRARKGSRPAAELSTVISLIGNFMRYRPYFPRSHLCLFDSLALVHFLATYGIYPDWVFGVREDPFSAHCWVQLGTLTLNDFKDRVALYTPILAA